jgi:hypothetical protein
MMRVVDILFPPPGILGQVLSSPTLRRSLCSLGSPRVLLVVNRGRSPAARSLGVRRFQSPDS